MTLDVWQRAADLFDPPVSPYLHDPLLWVTERTGEYLWSKQRQIAQSVHDHRYTAVPSCHGAGKSFLAARMAAWWIDGHPPNEAFVVSTAPSDNQVKAVLWNEIQKTHRLGKLPGRVTQEAQWKVDDMLVGMGRKPADNATGSVDETVTAFQGIHARYMLCIFDEACGIPKPLWVAGHSLLTNDDARYLAIGNPDNPSAEFARICDGAPEEGGMSARGWNVIPISIFDTPNFTGEAIPADLRPRMPSQAWLDGFVLNMGDPSTAIYASKVLGRFPTDRSDGVIPWSWLQACRGDEATARIGGLRVPVELGVDVGASDNGDLTVVRERRGMQAGRRWQVQSGRPGTVARTIVDAAKESGATRIKLDAIGAGWALSEPLQRDLPEVDIVPVDVRGAAAPGPHGERYPNLRSAIWWEVGRLLSRDRGWDLTEVDDRTLVELAEPKWAEDKAGRIAVEQKADFKKRLGRSPDDADALLLAFYEAKSKDVTRIVVHDQRLSTGRRAR